MIFDSNDLKTNSNLNMDLHLICSNCDSILENEEDENNCNYWFHEQKKYGNCDLSESYCVKCVKKYTLYDGRVESVCKRCQKYVDAFIKYPKFLEICILLVGDAEGFRIMDFIENTQIKDIFIMIENLELPSNDVMEVFETITVKDIVGDSEHSDIDEEDNPEEL